MNGGSQGLGGEEMGELLFNEHRVSRQDENVLEICCKAMCAEVAILYCTLKVSEKKFHPIVFNHNKKK